MSGADPISPAALSPAEQEELEYTVDDARVRVGRPQHRIQGQPLIEHSLVVAEGVEAGLAVIRPHATVPHSAEGQGLRDSCSMVVLMHTPPADVSRNTLCWRSLSGEKK